MSSQLSPQVGCVLLAAPCRMEKLLPPIDRGARNRHGDAYCRMTAERGFRSNSVCGLESGTLVHFPVTGFRAEKRAHRQDKPAGSGEPRGPKPHATCQIHKLARGAWGTCFGLGDLSMSMFGREGLSEGFVGSRRPMAHWRDRGLRGYGCAWRGRSSEKVPGRMFQ